MLRKQTSHKGQNGKVLVVGGNETFHGAPLLAALAAEKSGVDLTFALVPNNQLQLARQQSLNLIVGTFSGNFLRPQDVKKVVDWSQKIDVLVIGNGLGEKPQTLRAAKKILQQTTCDVVIDAAALQALDQVDFKERQVVLTPHRGELGKMLKKKVDDLSDEEVQSEVKMLAQEKGVTAVLKGTEDVISSPKGDLHINCSGHPIMTKGGTGDVLAGLIGGLMAQGMTGFEAAQKATEEWGKIGEYVAQKKGLMITLEEMTEELG